METLLLIGVLATVFFAFIEFIKKKIKPPQNQPQNQSNDDDKSSDNDNGSQDILSKFPAEALYHLKNAQDAELGNDYLAARVEYMACVDYLKRDKKAIPQIEFAKNEYSEFVRRDPIFNKMLPYFLEGVRQNQGILQSDITAKAEDMDWGELCNYNRTISKDDIRYVFYFAEEFGFLIRKKEGRSYRLYLPEQLKNVTEEKDDKEETKELPKKIDITKYDLLNFAMAHQASMKSEVEFYRSGNYLSYIKQRCLSLFLITSQ
jgi:hypothetical protein